MAADPLNFTKIIIPFIHQVEGFLDQQAQKSELELLSEKTNRYFFLAKQCLKTVSSMLDISEKNISQRPEALVNLAEYFKNFAKIEAEEFDKKAFLLKAIDISHELLDHLEDGSLIDRINEVYKESIEIFISHIVDSNIESSQEAKTKYTLCSEIFHQANELGLISGKAKEALSQLKCMAGIR